MQPHAAVSLLGFRSDKMLQQKQKQDLCDQLLFIFEVDIMKTRQQRQRRKSWCSQV